MAHFTTGLEMALFHLIPALALTLTVSSSCFAVVELLKLTSSTHSAQHILQLQDYEKRITNNKKHFESS